MENLKKDIILIVENLKKEDLKKDIIGFKNGLKKDIIEFGNGFKCMFNDLKTKGRRHKQIANLITLARLLLSLFIPPLAIAGGIANLKLVVGIAIAAALTDFVDGRVAKMLDAKSEFGAHLDPICDKLFATILLVPLMVKASPLLTLSLCVNLGLEAGIAYVNLNSKVKGNVPRTNFLGKVKTGALSVLICSSYLSFTIPLHDLLIPITELATIGLQTLTLIKYKASDIEKDNEKKKQKESNEPVGKSIEEPTLEGEKPINEIGTKDEVIIDVSKSEDTSAIEDIQTAIGKLNKLRNEVEAIRTGTPSDETLNPKDDKRKDFKL